MNKGGLLLASELVRHIRILEPLPQLLVWTAAKTVSYLQKPTPVLSTFNPHSIPHFIHQPCLDHGPPPSSARALLD
jgi:hypothetical protein